MSSFLCALHAPSGTPTALALVERRSGESPSYAVRALRTLSGDDPIRDLTSLLASEPQFVANATVVTTGGQAVADAIHERGPSAVAVSLLDGAAGVSDAHDVSTQTLVDTFERVYRAGDVEIDASLDLASAAANALHAAADLEAAAPDSDRQPDGDLAAGRDGETDALGGASYSGRGPDATVVEQSGSAESVSTETVESPISPAEATAAAVDAQTQAGRTATASAQTADLGKHAGIATALALAVWYGEASRDELPTTDKADEALANRVNRPDRRN